MEWFSALILLAAWSTLASTILVSGVTGMATYSTGARAVASHEIAGLVRKRPATTKVTMKPVVTTTGGLPHVELIEVDPDADVPDGIKTTSAWKRLVKVGSINKVKQAPGARERWLWTAAAIYEDLPSAPLDKYRVGNDADTYLRGAIRKIQEHYGNDNAKMVRQARPSIWGASLCLSLVGFGRVGRQLVWAALMKIGLHATAWTVLGGLSGLAWGTIGTASRGAHHSVAKTALDWTANAAVIGILIGCAAWAMAVYQRLSNTAVPARQINRAWVILSLSLTSLLFSAWLLMRLLS